MYLCAMIDLDQFKANAQSHGICEMLDDWNNAKSKKQLIDVALSIRGIEYIATAIAQGWGISPDVIERDFPMFINGRYTRDKDGYTSQMYCRYEGKIDITTTAALIIGFDGVIKADRPCELYIVNSTAMITGNGIPKVYAYNSKIEHPYTPIEVRVDKAY